MSKKQCDLRCMSSVEELSEDLIHQLGEVRMRQRH